MSQPETQWTDDPRVAPLLASIIANPPAIVAYACGWRSEFRDGLVRDQYRYSQADERIDALGRICDEHYAALDQLYYTDRALWSALTKQFLACQPSVDALVKSALEGVDVAPAALPPIPRQAAKVREMAL